MHGCIVKHNAILLTWCILDIWFLCIYIIIYIYICHRVENRACRRARSRSTPRMGCGGGWGGVGMMTFLALATDGVGGGGGDDDVPCTCTHVWCYATDGRGWVGMMMLLALAHMCDATQLMGGGGCGWWCYLHLRTCGSLRSVLALRHTSGQDVTQEKPASKISTPL